MANPEWTVIIDDLAARKCARSFSLMIKGTLSVVVLVKQHALIPSAAEVMRALLASGLRLDNEVIKTVLKQTVHEDW